MLALIVLGGVAGQASGRAAHAPRTRTISLLFVVNSSNGTLAPQPGHPGRFTLTLRRLEGHTVWFSDRPERLSGAFPSIGLAIGWKKFGFASDPPNAALDYNDPSNGSQRTVILELSHPRFDEFTNSVSLTARVLDPTTVRTGNLASHAGRADSNPPTHLSHPTLFIDDLTWKLPPAPHGYMWVIPCVTTWIRPYVSAPFCMPDGAPQLKLIGSNT